MIEGKGGVRFPIQALTVLSSCDSGKEGRYWGSDTGAHPPVKTHSSEGTWPFQDPQELAVSENHVNLGTR